MADEPEMSDEEADAGDAHSEQPSGQPNIDIVALAEKVYRLMLAEIRLDRARGLASEEGG